MMQLHAPQIKIKGEAVSFDEVLSYLIKIPADVLLLDKIMPYGDIIDLLPLIKRDAQIENYNFHHVQCTIEIFKAIDGMDRKVV